MNFKLQAIDDLMRKDHSCLTVHDRCVFLGEYTPRKGWAYSEMNNLILNLKKPLAKRRRPEYRYKAAAITQIASYFASLMPQRWLDYTRVPMPPSNTKEDPEYNDRLLQVLLGIKGVWNREFDIRELLLQCHSTPAYHQSGQVRDYKAMQNHFRIDASLVIPSFSQ